MTRVALGVEYAGDAFRGWQSQPHGDTVQDVLEAALSEVAAEPIRLHCAGRTDAGVHASTQVAHFDTSSIRQASAWVRGVNTLLPPAVVVRWAVEVDEEFHSRFSAYERRYRYILHNAPSRPGLLAGKVGWFHHPLDVERMAEAAQCLPGWHDFSAFRTAACQGKTPIKLMREASVQRHGEYLLFDFRANGFLHHMVRNLVGSLLLVGCGERPVHWPREVLDGCDRTVAGPTAPPQGLLFVGPLYPAEWQLPDEVTL